MAYVGRVVDQEGALAPLGDRLLIKAVLCG